jgi:MraZ protein
MSEDRSHVYQGAPRGAEDARVDDKGRLKLPAKFLEYLSDRKENTVFITTFDPTSTMSLIYPSSEWQYRQERWAEVAQRGAEFEEAIERRQVVADHYGADSAVDGQGRVLVPATLRKELALESAKVYLRFDRGRFNMLPETEYLATLNQALEGSTSGNKLLKSIGEG